MARVYVCGGVPCVPLPATPTMRQAPSASRAQGPRMQSPGAEDTEHPSGCELVPPALHSETRCSQKSLAFWAERLSGKG